MTKKEAHSLTSNGLDFLESAITHLTDEKNGKLKYAVLHLFSGTLLILKERIKQEHWSLLFQKVDNASLAKYQSGDFEGINYERVIYILKEIVQIELNKEDLATLNEVRKIRNKIEHFEYSITAKQLRPLAGRVLSFIIRFYELHLKDTLLEGDELETFNDIKSTARDFREYVDERIKVAHAHAEQYGFDVFHCVDCLELSLVKEDDDFKCYVCGLAGADVESVVEAHLENKLDIFAYETLKDGGELPQYDCPECQENSLVPEDKSLEFFICINCSNKVDSNNLHSCSRCGTVYYDKDDEVSSICSSCWEDISSKDD